MNRKIKLSDLKVKSFVTDLSKSDAENVKIKGGTGGCRKTQQTRCGVCEGPIFCPQF